MEKLNNEIVIENIKKKWGDSYDLSYVDYVNARTKIRLICPKHGEFLVRYHDLINGHGCKKCFNERISNKLKDNAETFITKAKVIHGNKYDYSKVEYIDSQTKVCIICPEHGEFWQKPNSHLNGNGCQLCSKPVFDTNSFIKEAKKIHGDKYDYSKVEYVNSRTKVCIICPEHGEFWQKPNSHLNGNGCNLCSKPIFDTNSFIKEAKKIHGDKYDYSKVEYKRTSSKVCIICPEHGEFWQEPKSHVSLKCGCPMCSMSHLEAKTMSELEKRKIKFVYQCDKNVFTWLDRQSLDFYLPDYNIAIECQGIQHFRPIGFFGGEHGFKYQKKLDERKKQLCDNNKIKLIYIINESEISEKINEAI